MRNMRPWGLNTVRLENNGSSQNPTRPCTEKLRMKLILDSRTAAASTIIASVFLYKPNLGKGRYSRYWFIFDFLHLRHGKRDSVREYAGSEKSASWGGAEPNPRWEPRRDGAIPCEHLWKKTINRYTVYTCSLFPKVSTDWPRDRKSYYTAYV